MVEFEVALPAGVLRAYDTGGEGLAVMWHHGTPNIGAPPAPLFDEARRLGLRWVSYDRPGYGGSSRVAGRDIATAAGYASAVADALGIERFVVMGHSGGGPHALACAALLPERVVCAVSGSGLAPFGAEGLDWFAGMAPGGEAALRAAAQGLAAKETFEAAEDERDPGFTDADWATLDGEWGWLGSVVAPALASGRDGHVDDDIAYVRPWGFDPARIGCPVLLVHGDQDRVVPSAHGKWLARHIPRAEWWLSTDDGHISVLDKSKAALEWISTAAS